MNRIAAIDGEVIPLTGRTAEAALHRLILDECIDDHVLKYLLPNGLPHAWEGFLWDYKLKLPSTSGRGSPEEKAEAQNAVAELVKDVVAFHKEGIARALGVPVFAVYEWIEAKPEFSAAVEQGWVEFRLQPPRYPSRYKYPAYTYALQLAARIKDPELARVLRAKMAEMKSIGPQAMAAFNDALWDEAMSIQPGRRIPKRAGCDR